MPPFLYLFFNTDIHTQTIMHHIRGDPLVFFLAVDLFAERSPWGAGIAMHPQLSYAAP